MAGVRLAPARTWRVRQDFILRIRVIPAVLIGIAAKSSADKRREQRYRVPTDFLKRARSDEGYWGDET